MLCEDEFIRAQSIKKMGFKMRAIIKPTISTGKFCKFCAHGFEMIGFMPLWRKVKAS
jgi:hypothetical protein